MERILRISLGVIIGFVLYMIPFIIGVQSGIHSTYKRIASGEVTVVPVEDSYRLEWHR